MVVCHCHVVSDRAIHRAICSGAQDVDAVGELCGAGAQCGGCVPGIEELLADAAAAFQSPAALARRQATRREGRHAPQPAMA